MSIGGNSRGHDLWPEIKQKRPLPDEFLDANHRKRIDRGEKESNWRLRSESPKSPVGDRDGEPRVSHSRKSKTENERLLARKHSLDEINHGNHSPPSSRSGSHSNTGHMHENKSSSGYRRPGSSSAMPEPDRQLLDRPQANLKPDDVKVLLKEISKYTDSVVVTSILAFQRELVKKKVNKQQHHRERWQKQSQSFVALTEDYDRASRNAVVLEESVSRQIEENSETQEKALRKLVTFILKRAGGQPLKFEEDESVTQEIERVKSEIKATNNKVEDYRYEMKKMSRDNSVPSELEHRLRDLTASSVPKSAMLEYESKVAELTVSLSKVQALLKEHKGRSADSLDAVSDKVKAVELTLSRATEKDSKLTENIDGHENQLRSLNEDLEAHKKDFERFSTRIPELERALVDRDNESVKREGKAGKIVDSLKRDHLDLKSKMQKLEDGTASFNKWKLESEPEISKFKIDVHSFADRLHQLEESMSTRASNESNTQNASEADMITLRTDLRAGLNDVRDRFNNLDDQQDMKDDLVAKEVERLDNLFDLQEKSIEKIKEDLSPIQTLVANWQNERHRSIDELFKSKLETFEKSSQLFKDSITERLDPMDIMVEGLQKRFDNLTTEHLSASIIHAMQGLYPPHPANVQQDLTQIKLKQQQADSSFYGHWIEIGRLRDHVNTVPSSLNELEKKFEDRMKKSEQELLRQVAGRAEGASAHLSKSLDTNYQDVKQRLLSDINVMCDKKIDSLRQNLIDEMETKFQEKIKPDENKRFQQIEGQISSLSQNLQINDETFEQRWLKVASENVNNLKDKLRNDQEVKLKQSQGNENEKSKQMNGRMEEKFHNSSDTNHTNHQALGQDQAKIISVEDVNGVNQKLTTDLEAEFGSESERFTQLEERMQAKLAKVEERMVEKLNRVRERIQEGLNQIEGRMENQFSGFLKSYNNDQQALRDRLPELTSDVVKNANGKNLIDVSNELEKLKLDHEGLKKTFENSMVKNLQTKKETKNNALSDGSERNVVTKAIREDSKTGYKAFIKKLEEVEDYVVRELGLFHGQLAILNQFAGVSNNISESRPEEIADRDTGSLSEGSFAFPPQRLPTNSPSINGPPDEANRSRKRRHSLDGSYPSEDEEDDGSMQSLRRSRRSNMGVHHRRYE